MKIGTGYTRIALADTLCFAPNPRNSHQSFLYLTNGQQVTVHGSLTSLERGSQFFFRSHRNCLINITKVSQINTHNHTVVLGLAPTFVPFHGSKPRPCSISSPR
ncbi:MAG: LytTR family transcriptional regulator DNA-binding domain-containing protein [Limosilactobacillus oris]|uniref:LytTR family DNA-binding domain-containing protein n=1 Tax=Limosilactobacillus oris TaxID=1632 RepID=UPI0021B4366B|nr:LytTR family DNA-binding domain-containing protein [Limosilactobacillus oris]MCH3910319.1 LytTR family transcriptional regulator DNA-binding domain-containing protein [Limosilactobacillus oris]MCH3939445.1 LytTR family transcriptional regulator DNA-binding domain-containing protein [Limosilactobacillus oris]MCI1980785.1 LytTR family transcriptional regulator DNA-binding domain-containing protein [Limosilactobacillus oris]MCI2043179.1 LytTR family transcriptional regulator DNA-binding domain-